MTRPLRTLNRRRRQATAAKAKGATVRRRARKLVKGNEYAVSSVRMIFDGVTGLRWTPTHLSLVAADDPSATGYIIETLP